ncbi:MAG: GNAT family protein [Anaerolineae bacterium]|nr:GNAT family N-acetyltransferase [Anaerolineae bacterium]MDW8299628.1 GNAT family protein [Anaerolineae bacterium]
MIKVEPITLTGAHVQLIPMQPDHADALWQAAQDESIWQWTLSRISSRADTDRYIAYALEQQALGNQLPFVTVSRATSEIVGSTRFDEITPEHRRVEIGWTWLNPRWQRTAINTEAKYLMLRHAFEVWQCVRVQLKTDALNVRSQRAIERLGAVREGVLRSHYIMPDGRRRDSVYYSFLDTEWQTVKAHIERLMSSYSNG